MTHWLLFEIYTYTHTNTYIHIYYIKFDPLKKLLNLKSYSGLLKSPCFPIQFTANFHENFNITFIIIQTDPELLKYKYIITSNSKLIFASWKSIFFKYILLLINFNENIKNRSTITFALCMQLVTYIDDK